MKCWTIMRVNHSRIIIKLKYHEHWPTWSHDYQKNSHHKFCLYQSPQMLTLLSTVRLDYRSKILAGHYTHSFQREPQMWCVIQIESFLLRLCGQLQRCAIWSPSLTPSSSSPSLSWTTSSYLHSEEVSYPRCLISLSGLWGLVKWVCS